MFTEFSQKVRQKFNEMVTNEKVLKVQMAKADYITECVHCSNKVEIDTSVMLMTNPPQYRAICSYCDDFTYVLAHNLHLYCTKGKSMDIEEIRKRKVLLEEKLTTYFKKHIEDFSKQTGLSIKSCEFDFSTVRSVSNPKNKYILTSVTIEVDLQL